MHQWFGSAVVQIMACRLFGAKLISKPNLGYCQLDPLGIIFTWVLIKIKSCLSWKCIWNYRLRNCGHFVGGGGGGGGLKQACCLIIPRNHGYIAYQEHITFDYTWHNIFTIKNVYLKMQQKKLNTFQICHKKNEKRNTGIAIICKLIFIYMCIYI